MFSQYPVSIKLSNLFLTINLLIIPDLILILYVLQLLYASYF